jgi:hypothetical protein
MSILTWPAAPALALNPPPTSITGNYNYQWAFGDRPIGGSQYAEVALNNLTVNYTPGFEASRSVNQTTFNTSGTQTLTVSVTPRDTLPNINLGVRISQDQYVNPTIKSVISPNGAPLYNYNISPNGKEMNIYFDNPTKDTTYTYTITIQLDLQTGVTQLEFMPKVQIETSQPIASGSVTGTSFSGISKDYSTISTMVGGTWTWSINGSITVDWYESLGKIVSFPSYSTANRVYSYNQTFYAYNAPGDTFSNSQVTGNRNWEAGFANTVDTAGQPVTSATISLDTTTQFGWTSPTVAGPPYQWYFGDMPEALWGFGGTP